MADRGDRLPLVFMVRIPGLATHLGWSFLRYQARRKRGVRAFRRQLLRVGMPKDRAAQLAKAYHEVGSIRQLIAGRGASRN